jgi:hypothetical protein
MQITTKIKQIFKIKCRDVIKIIKKKKKKKNTKLNSSATKKTNTLPRVYEK